MTLEAEKLDINTATKAELMCLPNIGELNSDKVLEFRAKHGPFQTIDALALVPGISPDTVSRVKRGARAITPRPDPPMTLRQWYAGMAMQALMVGTYSANNFVAQDAFLIADAMLAHEEKEKE